MAYEQFYVSVDLIGDHFTFTKGDGTQHHQQVFFAGDMGETDPSSLSFVEGKPEVNTTSAVPQSIDTPILGLNVGVWIYPAGNGPILDAVPWAAGSYNSQEMVHHNNIIYRNTSGASTSETPGTGTDWELSSFEALFCPESGGI